MTLAPVFAEGIFHQGAEGLGLLTGAMGVGAIIGTLSLARGRPTSQLPAVIFTSAAVLTVAFTIYACSPSYWICLAMMPFIGMAVMRHNAATNTSIQVRIQDDYRGRVMALYSMMVIGMFPIGSLLSGSLATYIGSRATVFVGGVGALVAAVVVYRRLEAWSHWLTE